MRHAIQINTGRIDRMNYPRRDVVTMERVAPSHRIAQALLSGSALFSGEVLRTVRMHRATAHQANRLACPALVIRFWQRLRHRACGVHRHWALKRKAPLACPSMIAKRS